MTDGEAMGFQPLTIAQGHVGFILGVPNGIILPIHISNNPQLGKHRVFVKWELGWTLNRSVLSHLGEQLT